MWETRKHNYIFTNKFKLTGLNLFFFFSKFEKNNYSYINNVNSSYLNRFTVSNKYVIVRNLTTTFFCMLFNSYSYDKIGLRGVFGDVCKISYNKRIEQILQLSKFVFVYRTWCIQKIKPDFNFNDWNACLKEKNRQQCHRKQSKLLLSLLLLLNTKRKWSHKMKGIDMYKYNYM